MATEKTNPKPKDKKEPKRDRRELRQKRERQADPGKPNVPTKQFEQPTREVDFMGWE